MAPIQSSDPTAILLATQEQSRASQVATIVLKQQANQDQALANMLAQAAQAALPPGQGNLVDIRA